MNVYKIFLQNIVLNEIAIKNERERETKREREREREREKDREAVRKKKRERKRMTWKSGLQDGRECNG